MTIELLNMDCLGYMRGCESDFFDSIVTSPPYDNLRDYGGQCEWGEKVWREVIREAYRIIKPGGVMCWVVADQVIDGSESGSSFRQALWAMDCGFNLHDTMIWFKDAVRFPCPLRYHDAFEYIFVLSKGKPQHFSPIKDKRNKSYGRTVHGTLRQSDGSVKKHTRNGKEIPEYSCRYNVWKVYNTGRADNFHPATFPLKLAHDLIVSWTPKGGRVFDPFAGSGTTGIAAHIHGCDFVGTEIDPEYHRLASERLNNETKQVAMF